MKRFILLVCCLALWPVASFAQTSGSCDQAQDFIDVSTYVQTQNYPQPELSVTCDDDTMTITSNGITNFEFIPITPTDLQVVNQTYEIPLEPAIADETTSIALLGTVAVAANGLPFFGPNEAANIGWGDPLADELLDFCNGHTGMGQYHYHASPICLWDDYEGQVGLIVGYALDGFPILAPYVCADEACSEVVELHSSYQRTQDITNAWLAHEYIAGSGDLDECNGMMTEDGYAYFATASFPYTLACYVGTPSGAQGITAEDAIETNFAINTGPNGGGPRQDGPPDLAAAAQQLGITEQALMTALGDQRPPNLAQAAQQLGITEQALRDALGR